MKTTTRILMAAALAFSSLSTSFSAEEQVKVQLRRVSLTPNAEEGVRVKRVVVNRPSGWLPDPQEVVGVRELLPKPVKEIRLDEIRLNRQERQSQVEKKKAGTLVAGLEKIFGNKSKKGAAPVALLPVGCGYCGDPQLTLVNTTFEPITVYSYDEYDPAVPTVTLLSGESTVLYLSYSGSWGIQVYGENTQSWLFDSGLVYFPCNNRETWTIADPFAALQVVNYTDFNDVYVYANAVNIGLVPASATYDFYFDPGTHRITITDVVWPNPVYYDSLLDLFANEITLLEVGY